MSLLDCKFCLVYICSISFFCFAFVTNKRIHSTQYTVAQKTKLTVGVFSPCCLMSHDCQRALFGLPVALSSADAEVFDWPSDCVVVVRRTYLLV